MERWCFSWHIFTCLLLGEKTHFQTHLAVQVVFNAQATVDAIKLSAAKLYRPYNTVDNLFVFAILESNFVYIKLCLYSISIVV